MPALPLEAYRTPGQGAGRRVASIRLIPHNRPSMNQRVKKWLTFVLRWGIAVVGIWWVISQITWRDRVTILNPNNRPAEVRLADNQPLDAREFKLIDGRTVDRFTLVSLPDTKKVTLGPAGGPTAELLALDLTWDLKRVQRLLVAPTPGGAGQWIAPPPPP